MKSFLYYLDIFNKDQKLCVVIRTFLREVSTISSITLRFIIYHFAIVPIVDDGFVGHFAQTFG